MRPRISPRSTARSIPSSAVTPTHAEKRAGDPDQKMAEQDPDDLPAREAQAEASRRGLVEPQRVEIEPDPGPLEPAHQHESPDQQQQADQEIIQVERELDA